MDNKGKKYLSNHAHYRETINMSSQYALISPYVDTTVVRTPEVTLKGIYHSRSNRFAGEEYLLNFRTFSARLDFRIGISRFQARDAMLSFAMRDKKENASELIKLPIAKKIRASFSSVLQARRSVRVFNGSIPLNDFATILYYSQGITGYITLRDKEEDAERIMLHATPSGGGFYPVRLYIVVWNVDKLPKGIYEYCPHHHSLRLVEKGYSEDDLKALAGFGNIKVETCAFCMAYVYELYVNSHKYGDAGAAYGFIEAGEIAENAQLTTTALGYGSCDIGGYNKQFIEKRFGLDGISKQVIHFTIFGNGGVI
ncbi:streptolysin associated protein SagB [Vallitalea longa]|uniref:Streptolysin associated protein SagB n=1 Tax=Vallitalea longa TaxID=2936439 RepID=A0A9W5YFU2_9FIRM|nr:SagB family peptide dehydrogenase [Vallitalea longa]GKX32006.1 streptolysin associated protein SagB [Vallitalea longa]